MLDSQYCVQEHSFQNGFIQQYLMSVQVQSIKAKMIKLQNVLNSQTKTINAALLIKEVLQAFQNVDMNDQKIVKNQLYSELRDTATAVFNYVQKIKNHSSEIVIKIEAYIKSLLGAIAHFCSAFYCKYFPLGCAEMIKDFLSNQCRLFVPEALSAAPQQEKEEILIQQRNKNWIWAKETCFKSIFYSEIIENIMNNLSKFQDHFGEMSILVIGQYLRLIYYMDDYIKADKILNLCFGHLETLQELFKSPTKQIMKDANKESLEEIQDYMVKLLRNTKNDQIKKRILLLGAKLAFCMINMQSIQKKMVACKFLNKFSYDVLYKTSIYMTEQYFAEWIIKQGFFGLIFQENCQASLIKCSQDTFKLLVKKGLIDQEKFNRFFEIIQKADNELRKAMFRLIDPFRIDYHQIESIKNILKTIKGLDFYDEEFFHFYEGVSRYATQTQLDQMIEIVKNILDAYYHKFSGYFTKRRAVECYAYIFDRIASYKTLDDKIIAYKGLASQFIEDPCENKLIMLKTLFYTLTDTKMPTFCQQKLAVEVIDDLQFIDQSIVLIEKAEYKDDLLYFIRDTIKKYKVSFQKAGFSKKTLMSAVVAPEIFQSILDLVSIQEQLELFSELALLSETQEFSFFCLRFVYLRMNAQNVKPIKKTFTDMIAAYVTKNNPNEFKGLEILTKLIFTSKRKNIRKGAAQLLVETFTNYQADFRKQGQIYLVPAIETFVKKIEEKLKDYIENQSDKTAVEGCLQLIEQFMLATEYFGVGSLRSHNSQIPTSATLLKIYNNATYGQDIQKIFEKKFPSNKTLFDVILQVSKQFKIGPLDMALQFPNSDMLKYHGLTLEELKLNGIQLNAIKLYQSRCKKELLIVDGELSASARKTFSEIFHKYAVNGQMTNKQCANCIEGLTLSFCPINDHRITEFFSKYDIDRDSKLTEADFLRFYKDCILDPQKEESVEKNLNNARYRRDLKQYNDDVDYISEQILFRHHLVKNKFIYDYLFKLVHDVSLDISQSAQRILLRLPTYQEIISQISQNLNFKDKNSFETEYMLTALQCSLNEQDSVSKLIAKNNHIVIFDKLSYLAEKEIKLQNDHNCLIICLHLLRSLLGNFDLKQFRKQLPSLAFQLPKTNIFINLIRESILKEDTTMLESSFGLQLTQAELPLTTIEESAFNKDKDMRIISCNFLYLWIVMDKTKNLNPFKLAINVKNNEQWFNLLTEIIRLKRFDNLDEIFHENLKNLDSNQENLQFCRFNPIINGNLKILKEIHEQLSQKQRQQLMHALNKSLPQLISNQNRELAFHLREQHTEQLLQDLSQITQIKMTKESNPRNTFVGIRNLGCICYMNSILQQFFMITEFNNLIMGLKSQIAETQLNGITLVDDFLSQLQLMYANLKLSQKQYYDPTKFCLAIKDNQGKPINTFIQEDAHEFLNTTFDKMEKYTKKQEKLKVLQNIFGGKTVTEIICKTCQNKNQVLEHYYHLSVQVKGMKTLKQSFDKLIQIEQISDYFCVHCNKKVDKITKQTFIKQTPEILIINLQRIIFDLQTFLKVKVHTKLQFQQKLDIHSYVSSSNKPAPYQLKGVVIHTGTSQGGHYYSLIKHKEKWYKFNDQSVTQFNETDLGRQAYGGDEVTDHWGDQSSSTNAYILFYEKIKQNQEELSSSVVSIDQSLVKKVHQENMQFTRQIQFNQPSFFKALKKLLKKSSVQPIKKQNIIKLHETYLAVAEHLSINSDITNQTLNEFKEDCIKIIAMLPKEARHYLQKVKIDKYKEVICSNNDAMIRDLHSKILLKYMTLALEDSQNIQFVESIMENLLLLITDDLLLKNLHKSYQFFELIKEVICNFKGLRKIFYKNDYLAYLLDILMGSDSLLSGKDKKKSDIHSSEAIPIVPIITTLILYKKNQKGYSNFMIEKAENYEQLSEKQSKILNQPNFYRRMMKNKIDMGLLSPIISLLSYKNETFCKMIAEVLIKAINSNEEIEDKNIVFTNIKTFLLVEDELTQERIKWMFGIPQLDSIRFNEQQFGMMTTAESKVYSYVSSLFYIRQEKYQPFLNILFDKRKYFNSFSAYAILMLLETINTSKKCLQYVLSLPAPSYGMKSYVDWIEVYLYRIKNQEHYSLPLDKHILATKLQDLLKIYKERIEEHKLLMNLPVNKKIIGKNCQYKIHDQYNMDGCFIQIFRHKTYVLENRPTGRGNQSMPDDQFSFCPSKEPEIAKYFLKSNEIGFQQNENLQKQNSMLTFQIKNTSNMTITFNIPLFRHKIYLKEGTHTINAPFCDKKVYDLIEVNITKEENKMPEVSLINNEVIMESPTQTTLYKIDSSLVSQMYMQIYCPICTYLNIGREKCQMCETTLLK